MYIDAIVVVALIIVAFCWFRKFSKMVYAIAIIDIFLRLINYIPSIVVIDLLWIIVICLISFIIPQILLFRIKPIDIIRAKE